MERFKIAAIVLVLFGGLSGSYLIIKNSIPAVEIKNEIIEKSSISEGTIIEKPIQWVKNLSFKNISDVFEEKKALINQQGIVLNNSNSINNYTESIAKSMFDKMKTMDQNGDNPFENINLNDSENKEITQNILADLENFSSGLNSVKNIDIKDIKISKDNSLEAKAKYLESVGKIIMDNSSESYNKPHIAVERLAVSGDVARLDKLISAYSNILNNLLITAAPSDFSDIHYRYVNFLNKTKTFYSEIKVFKNDPIRIQLLVSLIAEITKEDLDIKQEFYQKVLEINS